MRRTVIEASVFGLVILQQTTADRVHRLRGLLAECAPVQPAHWPLEIAGLTMRGTRDARLTPETRASMRDRLTSLVAAAEIDGFLPAAAVFDVAQRFGLSVYDAPYLELAMRRGLPLLTSDDGLCEAAARAGVAHLPLP